MQRISKVTHEYAGRQLKVGEAFDCDQAHVHLLLALGRIEREDIDAPKQFSTGQYSRRDMVAEGTLHAKRKYTRKAA